VIHEEGKDCIEAFAPSSRLLLTNNYIILMEEHTSARIARADYLYKEKGHPKAALKC